jgi:hypothetical protein
VAAVKTKTTTTTMATFVTTADYDGCGELWRKPAAHAAHYTFATRHTHGHARNAATQRNKARVTRSSSVPQSSFSCSTS